MVKILVYSNVIKLKHSYKKEILRYPIYNVLNRLKLVDFKLTWALNNNVVNELVKEF